MIQRILFTALLLFFALFLPFWTFVFLSVFGIFYFAFFWESVALFLLSDVLFGVAEARFFDSVFVGFIISAIILLLVEWLKRKLKFYRKR